MRRILHITGCMNRAGAETMLMNLYRYIDRSLFQFDFVSFSPNRGDYDDEIEELGGRVFQILETNPIKRMRKLTQLLQTHSEWETIHCHTLFSNAFHLYAGYKAGVKQRITHSHSTSSSSKSIISNIYHFVSRKIQAHYATHFVACGKDAGIYLFEDRKDVLIVPNSIDLFSYYKKGKAYKDYLRNQFKLTPESILILQLGRLENVKNHKFSIGVLKALKEKNVSSHFFIVGQGSMDKELKNKIIELDLEDQVHFLGLRNDVAEILSGSDIMIMPSLYEGFPVVLVESQATGTPALIADTISSEVDLGVGLIHYLDLKEYPKVWADAIVKISQDKEELKEEQLKQIEEKGFDVKSNVRLLEKIYSEI